MSLNLPPTWNTLPRMETHITGGGGGVFASFCTSMRRDALFSNCSFGQWLETRFKTQFPTKSGPQCGALFFLSFTLCCVLHTCPSRDSIFIVHLSPIWCEFELFVGLHCAAAQFVCEKWMCVCVCVCLSLFVFAVR